MEINQPEAAAVSGQSVASQSVPAQAKATPERAAFTASKHEIIAAFLTYALAYVYVLIFLDPDITYTVGETTIGHADAALRIYLPVFTLGFAALAEWLHHDAPRARESWVWLGCTAAVLCSVVLERGRVWGGSMFWFLHIFAVWWALSRSGTLLEGESGRFLPLDALNGFLAFPFKHFFLRFRTAGFALARLRGERKREKPESETVFWTVVMSAAALGLLAWAVSLLISSDSGFAALLDGFVALFRFEWDINPGEFLFRFLLSLPVGAYLYGLLGGTLRENKDALRKRAAGVGETLELLRGVPERAWLVLLTLFCAVYALYFVVQGRYLFGAFTRTLPPDFSVSEYARQGFFELCKVMAVNFVLLWLVTRSSKTDVRRQKAARALCLALLSESFLFAVVALSKLALYIDCFGFTPKRLQSTWLVCVLAFGCGCAAWSLVKERKTFRAWMYFGAVTLALLCLY